MDAKAMLDFMERAKKLQRLTQEAIARGQITIIDGPRPTWRSTSPELEAEIAKKGTDR